jgi:hypothetical protein
MARTSKPPVRDISTLYCSFCGKSQHEVRKLISGPTVFICDECIDACVAIILDKVSEEDVASYFKQTLKSEAGKDLLTLILTHLESEPLFSIAELGVNRQSCFYLGPFIDPFNEIYADFIKPIVIAAGYSITRADEIFGSRAIMQDIWDGIYSAGFIVADVTGKNPNVMYEIGLAHTMGKQVIMLTQDLNDVPFDLRHYRCVVYSFTPKGGEDLKQKIAATIQALSKVNYKLSFQERRRSK